MIFRCFDFRCLVWHPTQYYPSKTQVFPVKPAGLGNAHKTQVFPVKPAGLGNTHKTQVFASLGFNIELSIQICRWTGKQCRPRSYCCPRSSLIWVYTVCPRTTMVLYSLEIFFQSKGKKPLFVQFVLENIWSVYDAVMVRRYVNVK